MVDLQGKYYVLDELDKNFIEHCVDVEGLRTSRRRLREELL
jgi:hypothetical protein